MRVLNSSVVFALLSPVLLHQLPALLQTRKVIRIEHHGSCDSKFYQHTYANISLTRNGSNTMVAGEAITSRDLNNPLSGQLHVLMCEDLSDRKTCKVNNNLEWKDLCGQRMMTYIFKIFVDKFKPPIDCPMKKGHYYFRDVGLPTDILVAFLPQARSSRVLWILRMFIRQGRQIVSCYELGFRVADARIRH